MAQLLGRNQERMLQRRGPRGAESIFSRQSPRPVANASSFERRNQECIARSKDGNSGPFFSVPLRLCEPLRCALILRALTILIEPWYC